MKLADGIRKHGFRKWYERELMQSHGHLALTFLSGVGVMGAFEAFTTFRAWSEQLMNIVALGACVGIGLWSLRRYLYLLHHAEAAAHQAVCKQCGTYGRLRLVPRAPGAGVAVCCTKCQHEWHIAD